MSTNLVLNVASDVDLSETGGAHATKGMDFQRYWAIAHMLALEERNRPFLLLFETIQDVCELNSETAPTKVHVFQVKKKDRNEWTWNELTGLPSKAGKRAPNTDKFKKSTIGRLLASVAALDAVAGEGHFVSNAGCTLELTSGVNAATTESSPLSLLTPDLSGALLSGIASALGSTIELTRLSVRKVAIHPDSPDTYVIGRAVEFLSLRSPKHAGQAQSLVRVLMTRISPLGRHTGVCSTFEELTVKRGFSASELKECLARLEQVPDANELLSDVLRQLQVDGLDVFQVFTIRKEAAGILARRLNGLETPDAKRLRNECRQYMSDQPILTSLLEHFETAYHTLGDRFPGATKAEIWAQLALNGVA